MTTLEQQVLARLTEIARSEEDAETRRDAVEDLLMRLSDGQHLEDPIPLSDDEEPAMLRLRWLVRHGHLRPAGGDR